MKARSRYEFPTDKRPMQRKAIWLEALTLPAMLSVIVAIYLTMGNSQAMKTAWIEDLLSLVPPISYLISVPVRHRSPSERFPYGFYRAGHIAFLCASTALAMFGLFLLYESIQTLITRHHVTIGTTVLFGYQIWSGWLMVAALTYSAIVPVILGRLKIPVARELHEKVIYTDSQMNKDDWLTALAAAAGVLGIGMGWWWADAVASGIISLEVTKDGVVNLKRGVFDLTDERPTDMKGKAETDLEQQILDAVHTLPWVKEADLRLREEGSLVTGEVMIVPRDEADPIGRIARATQVAHDANWRCYDITVTLVDGEHLHRHDAAP